MDILKSSQLVIFSHSTTFITFSYRSIAGFLFKLLTKFEVAKTGSGVGILRLTAVWAACLCQPITWSMAAILRDSVVVVVVVRTRPRAIPLAMITIRKFINGFPFLSHMSMGLRLAVLRAVGAPLFNRELKHWRRRRQGRRLAKNGL